MRLSLGFPDHGSEREILSGLSSDEKLKQLPSFLNADQLIRIQKEVAGIFVSDAFLDYLQRLLQFSRDSDVFTHGLSTRAGLALKQCAQAWAFIDGRNFVSANDLRSVLPYVCNHRLQFSANYTGEDRTPGDSLSRVEIP